MLTGRQSLYTIGAMVFLATAAMLSATVLTALDKLDAAACTGIIGTALGIAGAIGAATSGATNPQQSPPPTRITTPQGVTVETNGAISEHAPGALRTVQALVNTVTHWAFGMFSGVQYGIVAACCPSRGSFMGFRSAQPCGQPVT